MRNELIKPRFAFILLIIIAIIYVVLTIYIALSISLQWITLMRCFMVFSSIIAFAFIIKKNTSLFLSSFSIPFAFFLIFDVIYSLINSIISHKDLLFYNNSFLSHTEGFLFFSFFIYFISHWKRK